MMSLLLIAASSLLLLSPQLAHAQVAQQIVIQAFHSSDLNSRTGRTLTPADFAPAAYFQPVENENRIEFTNYPGFSRMHTLRISVWIEDQHPIMPGLTYERREQTLLHFKNLAAAQAFLGVVTSQPIHLLLDYSRDYESWIISRPYSEGFDAHDGVYVYIPSQARWVPLMTESWTGRTQFSQEFTDEYLQAR